MSEHRVHGKDAAELDGLYTRLYSSCYDLCEHLLSMVV